MRSVKVAFAAMAAVFVLHAVLFFVRTAPSFVHSDAATEILLTALTMEAKSPLVSNFYYVNGDYWIFGAQWLAAPIVLVFGVTAKALLATNIAGLAIELAVLTWAFRKVDDSLVRALFGALVTLFSWSVVHMLFEYVELSYSVLTTCHLAVFALYARALAPPDRRRRDVAVAVFVFFLFAVQNPQRALGFELVPVLGGCLWRWESTTERPWRIRVAAITGASWLLAAVLHRFVLTPLVTPAVQAGMSLGLRGPAGIVHNVELVVRGFIALAAPREDQPWTAVFGLAVIGGAAAFVIRFAFRSRAYEPARFLAIVILADVGFVLLLFIFGDMLTTPMTVRYVLPGLLPLLGLGCVLAARAVADADTPARWRQLALAWLFLLPFDGLIATSRRVWGAREVYSEADPLRLQAVADELVRRDLRHGFATYWNANTTTLLSGGATKTCGIAFRDEIGLVPRKWLVDTRCFRASELPPSIYVIAAPGEHAAAAAAMSATLFPEPIDRFEVDGFEVRVFRTADSPRGWLDLARPRL